MLLSRVQKGPRVMMQAMKGPFYRWRKVQSRPGTKARALVTMALVALAYLALWRSAATTRLLIYVPVHYTNIDKLHGFVDCLSSKRASSTLRMRVDVLVLTSGNRELSKREVDTLKSATATLGTRVPYLSKVRTAHVIVANDHYDKRMSNSKWVAGPNEVFYRGMARNGDIYERHIQPGRYRAVQQFEVDTCPIREGWLSALVAEADLMSRTSAVISGPRVDGPLVCSSKPKSSQNDTECVSAEEHPDYIRQHINGNAMYRIGDTLHNLVNAAASLYPDWPYDLAVYLAANQTNSLNLLRYTNFASNRVVPVAIEHAFDPALYDTKTFFVHCPFEYKKETALIAAKATLARERPVFVIAACHDMHPQILLNLQLSMQRRGVSNVVWATGKNDHQTLRDVMQLKPVALAESADMMRLPALGECMPPLDVVGALADDGYDVFGLSGDAVVRGNLSERLLSLSKDAIYFASAAVQSYGHFSQGEIAPRYHFTSKAFYVPASRKTEWRRLAEEWRAGIGRLPSAHPDSVLSAGANCTSMDTCSWKAVPIRLLSPLSYVSGVNMAKLWPNKHSLAKKATLLIGISSDSMVGAADNATRVARLNHARFRMQQVKQWLLPYDDACCSSVLAASDIPIDEDAETVLLYADTVMEMGERARQKRFACAVPPGAADVRTGERLSFDMIFDASATFGTTRIFPSLAHVPFCSILQPSLIENVTVDTVPKSQRRHWPLEAFSKEVRDAFNLVSKSHYLRDIECVDDARRTSAEAALQLLRESASSILAQHGRRRVYLAGKWRILDKHARKQMPNAITLLSPALYPPSTPPSALYSSFGVGAQYPRLGEDPIMDVLDFLVCTRAGKATRPSAVAPMALDEIYAGIFEHISSDVLSEDLGLSKLFAAPDPSASFLIPMDKLENNGFSNLVNAAQVLAYVSNRTGTLATMVPLSLKHLTHTQSPWSTVIANVTRVYANFPSLRPPLWAILRHPSLLIEVLDGYMVPAGRSKLWTHGPICSKARTSSCIASDNPAHLAAKLLYSPITFKRLHVAHDEVELERLMLMGYDAVSGVQQAYLGLSDSQLDSVFGSKRNNGRDVVFRPFRAFNFQNHNSQHISFAKSWQRAFRFTEHIYKKARRMRSRLSPDFTCYHARVAGEFTAHHLQRPDFKRESVYAMLSRYVEMHEVTSSSTSVPGIYITTDTHDPVEKIIGRSTSAVLTCHEYGCGDQHGDVVWGAIERLVCASAKTFLGNVYSTFTLSVCGLRNDQRCKDYFNQSLADGRLLF